MTIILNEKLYAEELLKNYVLGNKPSETLGILVKYFYNMGYNQEKIRKELNDFMEKSCTIKYNPDKWQDTFDNLIKQAKKYKLKEIDYISITENELKTISSIKNKPLERLAFTLLCLSKLANKFNPNNNDWSNRQDKEVFKLANIQVNITKQCLMINDLKNLGLIEYSKIIDNINTKVLFIDEDSKEILKITKFRDLGNEYLFWKGEKFKRCRECGKLIRPNKQNNNSYCNECKAYQPIVTKVLKCIDCGEEFVVDARNTKTIRCNFCQKSKNRERKRNWKRNNK